jgi:hypothetical protein
MRSGKTLSGFRATLLSLCRLRSLAWATWVLSVPHTSDSWTFWQSSILLFKPVATVKSFLATVCASSLTVLYPYIEQRQGQAPSNHRVGLRSRLDLKSRSRKRRPTRLQVMQDESGRKLGEDKSVVLCQFFGKDKSFVLVEAKVWEHAVEFAGFEATKACLMPKRTRDVTSKFVTTIWEERHPAIKGGTLDSETFSRNGFPQPHGIIPSAAGQPFPIRAKDYATDRVLVSLKPANLTPFPRQGLWVVCS